MNLGPIMSRRLITVHPDDSVAAVRRLFELHGFHHLLVVEQGRLLGVISDRDLLKNLSPFIGSNMERTADAHLLDRRVHQIMRRKPVTATPDTPYCDAARLMVEQKISCLPILDPETGRPVGIVTWRDLLCAVCPLEPAPT